jgi:hypothetical protein
MSEKSPTYEELKSERAKEWAEKQAIAAKTLDSIHAGLQQMPDVRDAPSSDHAWSHPDIHCPGQACAGKEFRVTKWVTVNGLRHRAELRCVHCGLSGTWDWNDRAWME